MADVEGATRPLAESAESVTACAELRAHGASSVERFFGAKAPHKD
jgi:hypothetical protein